MPFFEKGICKTGKHAGSAINEVPDGYLEWLLRDSEENASVVKAELARRRNKVDNSFMMKIIQHGKRELLGANPTPEDVQKIEYAYKNLEQAIIDAGKVD